jgi:hypothetical protein
MFPFKLLQAHSLGLGLTAVAAAAALGVGTTPANAEIKIIGGADFYGSGQSPSVGGFIYGSPIPTPIPVNPATGLAPNPAHNSLYPHRVYHSYPEYDYYSYPDDDYYNRRGGYYNRDTILVNPVLVNPSIKNSTLVNPTIIDSYGRKRVRNHIIIKSW